jgi:4-carboxymuconolactone decarboxylase
MARVPEITSREQLPEEARQNFDAIMKSRGRVAPPYSYFLNAPDIASRMEQTLYFSRFMTGIDKKVKELAICTLARELNAAFEWAAHSREAAEAGVRTEAIQAVRNKTAPTGLTADEATVIMYVQELLRPPFRISDATYDAFQKLIGPEHLAQMTCILGAYSMLAVAMNAFAIEAPEGADQLPV